MKKLLLLILICAASVSFAQTSVPDKVKSAFTGKFPNASNLKWEAEDDEYEAAFNIDSANYSAIYNDKGVWQETSIEIVFDNLPDAVKQTVKKTYKDADIKGSFIIEDSEGQIYYEVDVLKDNKKLELYYNKNGSEADD